MNSKALLPDEVVQLVPQHARRRRARVEDAAVGAEERDRVPAVFDERAEALLAGFERGLRLVLFGERVAERELDEAAARDDQREDDRDADEDQDLQDAIGRLRRQRGSVEQDEEERGGCRGRRPQRGRAPREPRRRQNHEQRQRERRALEKRLDLGGREDRKETRQAGRYPRRPHPSRRHTPPAS